MNNMLNLKAGGLQQQMTIPVSYVQETEAICTKLKSRRLENWEICVMAVQLTISQKL